MAGCRAAFFIAVLACAAGFVAAAEGECSATITCDQAFKPGQCCSAWGHCGTSELHCLPAQGCVSNCWSANMPCGHGRVQRDTCVCDAGWYGLACNKKVPVSNSANTKLAIGYMANYHFYEKPWPGIFHTIAWDKLTHVIFSSGMILEADRDTVYLGFDWRTEINDTKIAFDGDTSTDYKGLISQLRFVKQAHPNLKVLFSLRDDAGYPYVTDGGQKSLTFAKSVRSFFETYTFFDGLDMDLEGDHDDKTYTNFALLARDIKDALKTTKTGKQYLLTTPTRIPAKYIAATLPYFDLYQLMTYEFTGPSFSPFTGHDSPLYASDYVPEVMLGFNDINTYVMEYTERGVPPAKLAVGVPFFGVSWQAVNDTSTTHGLFQKFNSSIDDPNDHPSYADIKAQYQQGYTKYFDDSAKATYSWNPTKKNFVSYDDRKSMLYKGKYVCDHGLAGLMIWDLGYDSYDGELLNAVYDARDCSKFGNLTNSTDSAAYAASVNLVSFIGALATMALLRLWA